MRLWCVDLIDVQKGFDLFLFSLITFKIKSIATSRHTTPSPRPDAIASACEAVNSYQYDQYRTSLVITGCIRIANNYTVGIFLITSLQLPDNFSSGKEFACLTGN